MRELLLCTMEVELGAPPRWSFHKFNYLYRFASRFVVIVRAGGRIGTGFSFGRFAVVSSNVVREIIEVTVVHGQESTTGFVSVTDRHCGIATVWLQKPFSPPPRLSPGIRQGTKVFNITRGSDTMPLHVGYLSHVAIFDEKTGPLFPQKSSVDAHHSTGFFTEDGTLVGIGLGVNGTAKTCYVVPSTFLAEFINRSSTMKTR